MKNNVAKPNIRRFMVNWSYYSLGFHPGCKWRTCYHGSFFCKHGYWNEIFCTIWSAHIGCACKNKFLDLWPLLVDWTMKFRFVCLMWVPLDFRFRSKFFRTPALCGFLCQITTTEQILCLDGHGGPLCLKISERQFFEKFLLIEEKLK